MLSQPKPGLTTRPPGSSKTRVGAGLDLVKQATNNVRADAVTIIQLCAAAGKPEMASHHILAGTLPDQVRSALNTESAATAGARSAGAQQLDDEPFGRRLLPVRGTFDPSALEALAIASGRLPAPTMRTVSVSDVPMPAHVPGASRFDVASLDGIARGSGRLQ